MESESEDGKPSYGKVKIILVRMYLLLAGNDTVAVCRFQRGVRQNYAL